MDELVVDSYLKIKDSHPLAEKLRQACFVANPEYINRAKMGYSTAGIKRLDPIYKHIGNEYWFPRGIVNRYVKGRYKIIDKTVLGEEVDFRSKIKLRTSPENQEDFVRKFMWNVEHEYGAIGQAGCGFGKTICSLDIIAKLKRTTIIVVHKTFLVDQWAENVSKFYDIDPKDIGFVAGDVVDWQGKKIVIALVQSLLAKDMPESFYDSFGTFAIDECHRFGAPTFREIIGRFKARYRLGVTATPKRKDDLQEVFFKHIGEIKAIGEARKIKAEINMVRSKLIVANEKQFYVRGRVSLVKVITHICESEARNRQIARIVVNAVKKDRKIIVFTDRREHLVTLKNFIEAECKKEEIRTTIGYYAGGMEQKDLDISATRQVILGTFAMGSEGLDIPDLDTLILATPRADVEQVVGRILRVCEDKKQPVVVDLVDSIGVCLSLANKRKIEYTRLGYKIK